MSTEFNKSGEHTVFVFGETELITLEELAEEKSIRGESARLAIKRIELEKYLKAFSEDDE